MAAAMERRPRPLTSEEQAKPYAKFYTMEFPGPDPATVALMARDHQFPLDQMLMPEDLDELLEAGDSEAEMGWGMIDNGTAKRHAARMPAYAAMVNWWFASGTPSRTCAPHLVPAVPPRCPRRRVGAAAAARPRRARA